MKRYAAYAAASDIIGTNHVQMVATFWDQMSIGGDVGPPRSNGNGRPLRDDGPTMAEIRARVQ